MLAAYIIHTSLYFAISANCAEAEGRDDADGRRYADDDARVHYASLGDDPGETQEEHHTPDVQQTGNQDTLDPAELDALVVLLGLTGTRGIWACCGCEAGFQIGGGHRVLRAEKRVERVNDDSGEGYIIRWKRLEVV